MKKPRFRAILDRFSLEVIYSSVGLRSRVRTRGHLGAKVFRRPAGVDVTRLSTLQRAASLCGHDQLLELVETTMESLRPKNVAKIPWSEVERHGSKEDLWLLIDGKARLGEQSMMLDVI